MSSLFLDPCSTLSSLALKRISTTTQSSLLRCVCVPPPCFETNCKGGKGKAAEGEKKPCLGPRIISISLSLSLRTYTHTHKKPKPNHQTRVCACARYRNGNKREREKRGIQRAEERRRPCTQKPGREERRGESPLPSPATACLSITLV